MVRQSQVSRLFQGILYSGPWAVLAVFGSVVRQPRACSLFFSFFPVRFFLNLAKGKLF